jgi:signal peptidase I
MLSAAYVRRSVLEAFYLPTSSMSPTLRSGDRILVNKTSRRLEHLARYDVVVFKSPENRQQNFIKRIVGLPGDDVQIENGNVSVNGISVGEGNDDDARERTGETQTDSASPDASDDDNEAAPRKLTVPPGMCFLIGDNLTKSLDSRKFGPVPLGDIIGVAEYVYLPGDTWKRFGTFR